MTNTLFGFPVWNDPTVSVTPTYSGGSWVAGLPLTNLSDRRLAYVARSTDAARASTQLQGNLQTSRSIGLVAIPKHTISASGKVRVRLWSVAPAHRSRNFASGWSSVGTPTRSADAFTASDGVPMDLIGDDAAGALEGYTQVRTFTGDAVKIVECRVKQDTSTSSVVRLRDTTASADRLLQVIAWSAGAPSITQTTGTLVSSTQVATGVYRLVFLTTSVTAANTNQVEIYPATTGALATANTGTLYVADVDSYNQPGDPLKYDSGYIAALPAGLTAEDLAGLNVPFVVTPSVTGVRDYVVEIDDTTNTAGYIDLARLIVASAYQPTINMDYGVALDLEDDSERTVSDGGAGIYNVKSKRRTATFVLDEIPEAEAFTSVWRMKKQLGTTGQFFWMWAGDDTTYKHERGFLAVFRDVSGLSQPNFARYRSALSLVEEL